MPRHDNPAEKHVLPLQLAIDNAITNSSVIPQEYMFTSLTETERKDNIRIRYMGGIITVLAVAFFIGMVGVSYQLTVCFNTFVINHKISC